MSAAKLFLPGLFLLLGPLVGAVAGFFVSNVAAKVIGIGMHDVGPFVAWFLIGGAVLGLLVGIVVAYRIAASRSQS